MRERARAIPRAKGLTSKRGGPVARESTGTLIKPKLVH